MSAISKETTINRVVEAVRAGDLDGAKQMACKGLAAGAEHPLLLNLRALDHENAGRFDQALTDLRRAHILAPRDFAILNACGLCLARLDRYEEAVECFERALEIRGDFGPAWFNKGWSSERIGQTAEASKCYLRAVDLNPENAQAWANLSHLAARRGDEIETRRSAEKAMALQPGHPTAILALASIELAMPSAAEERIRNLLEEPTLGPLDRGLALGLLGDALDAQDRPDEAFEAYTQSNALFRSEAAPRFEAPGQTTLAETMEWLVAWADSLTPSQWGATRKEVDSRGSAIGHIFLIGFPRSGTTLAESILVRHPDVVSLEEKNTLGAGVVDFLGNANSASRLASLGAPELQAYREDYWNRVRAYGVDPTGKIFLDKHPFNTLKLPLIYAMFPRSKIIFSMRDPRDVVFSCFRRRFGLNASMYEFLELKRTAMLYNRAMQIADIFSRLQSMRKYDLIYEHLVHDFEAEAKALCEFIGVDWRPELIDFTGRAKRGEIASASSAQIARGLYADGIGHWQRYARHLEAVQEILAPWVRQFGYAEWE